MGVCADLAKCILAVINVILWVVAVVLIFVAGWISREYFSYRNHLSPLISAALVPVFVVLVAGLLLFLFIVVGCVALVKEHKCLLALFFLFLLVILLAFVSGFVAAIVLRERLETNLYDRLHDGIANYKSDWKKQDHIDFIQTEFVCCGVANYTDWKTTSWFNQSNPDVAYPTSCCKNSVCHYEEQPDRNLNGKGCYEEVKNTISNHFVIILSSAAGCSLLLILGMICSCVLFCHERRRVGRHYVGLTNTEETE